MLLSLSHCAANGGNAGVVVVDETSIVLNIFLRRFRCNCADRPFAAVPSTIWLCNWFRCLFWRWRRCGRCNRFGFSSMIWLTRVPDAKPPPTWPPCPVRRRWCNRCWKCLLAISLFCVSVGGSIDGPMVPMVAQFGPLQSASRLPHRFRRLYLRLLHGRFERLFRGSFMIRSKLRKYSWNRTLANLLPRSSSSSCILRTCSSLRTSNFCSICWRVNTSGMVNVVESLIAVSISQSRVLARFINCLSSTDLALSWFRRLSYLCCLFAKFRNAPTYTWVSICQWRSWIYRNRKKRGEEKASKSLASRRECVYTISRAIGSWSSKLFVYVTVRWQSKM